MRGWKQFHLTGQTVLHRTNGGSSLSTYFKDCFHRIPLHAILLSQTRIHTEIYMNGRKRRMH